MEAEHAQPSPEHIWLSRMAAQHGQQQREGGERRQLGESQVTEPEEARSQERVEELALLALVTVSNASEAAENISATGTEIFAHGNPETSPRERERGKEANGEKETERGIEANREGETDALSLSVDEFRARSERLTVGLGDAIARSLSP